ncbi:MAG: ribosome maturation factor RimP [Actinomycetota bacterium]
MRDKGARHPRGRIDRPEQVRPGNQAVLEERVRSLVEPVLARHDAELVELSVHRGRTQLVRVVADREGGIDLDTCAEVSVELSRMLDADDPIVGRYTLEVTSPGLGRPLRTPADYRRVLGRRVRVVLADGQHEGTLEEVGEDRVRLTTESEPVEVALVDVRNAKVVLPW